MSYNNNNTGLMTSTISREKTEMRQLNDCLSNYMQKMRALRQAGPGTDYHEALRKLEEEMMKLKSMYDAELDKLRRQLEESNRQKHQLSHANDKNMALISELQNKLASETERGKRAQDEITNLQKALAALEKELADMRAQNSSRNAEFDRMRPEYCRLKRENDELKKRLEEEKDRRAAAEEALKQNNDKSGFDRQLLEQRNRELQERLKASNDIIKSLEGKIRQLSGSDDLANMLKKLRDGTAEELRKYQRATEDALNKTLGDLKAQQEKDARDKERLMKENDHLKNCLRQLQQKVADLEARLASMTNENNALKRDLDTERANAQARIRDLNARAEELQNQLMDKLKDFTDARDAQASLRAEIETYRRLLEQEGANAGRLNTGKSTPTYAQQKPGSALPDIGKGSGKQAPGTAPGYKTTYRVSYNKTY